MIGEVGTVRSPVGVEYGGWVFAHDVRWRAVLAFAPEERDSRGEEPVIEVGRKVVAVGFGYGAVLEVMHVDRSPSHRDFNQRG